MNLKRLLLTLLLLLILVACGREAPAAEKQSSEPTAAAETGGSAATTDGEKLNLPPDVDVQTVATIKDRDDVFVMDVREQSEYDEKHIPGITLIPMSEVSNRLNEIPKDKTVIVTCNSGNRSGQVTEFLRQNGYTDVHNMLGGIQEWDSAGFDVER